MNIFNILLNFFTTTVPSIFNELVKAVEQLFISIGGIDFVDIIKFLSDFISKIIATIIEIIQWLVNLF